MAVALSIIPMAMLVHTALPGKMTATLLPEKDGIQGVHSKFT
jgi:hypothetical protein